MEKSEILKYLKGKNKSKRADSIMKDLGMERVKSESGKIYYE